MLCCVISVLQSQDNRGVDININGGVEFLIKDAKGRISGFDPRSRKRSDDINSSYGVFSVDSENPDVEPPEPAKVFMTYSPAEGIYRLTLFGTKLSSFTMYVTLSGVNAKDSKQIMTRGVIDSGAVQDYQFVYSLTPSEPYRIERIFTAGTLQSDINNCFLLGMLGGKEFSTKLIRGADEFDAALAKSDSSKARHQLEEMKRNIQEVYEKSSKEEKKKHEKATNRAGRNPFMNDAAFSLLTNDIHTLLENFQRMKDKEDRDGQGEDDHERMKEKQDRKGNE